MKKRKVFLSALLILSLLCSLFGCGRSADQVETPQSDSVVYAPDRTLAEIQLPDGWSWDRGETVPTVDVTAYPATYSADGLTVHRDIPLRVEKASPVTPAPRPVAYSPTQSLRGITLGEGWSWLEPDTVPTVSGKEYPAKFTPADNNYLAVESRAVPLEVRPIDPELPAPVDAYPEEHACLGDISLPAGWSWLEPDRKLGTEAGSYDYDAVFSDEAGNYNDKSAKVKVNLHEPALIEATLCFIDESVRQGGEKFPQPLGTILPEQAFAVQAGETIAAFTVRALQEKGIGFSYTGSTKEGFYLDAIKNFRNPLTGEIVDSMGSGDCGDYSGWTVYRNGVALTDAASAFSVQAGDEILWMYVCDPFGDWGM